MCGIAGVWGKSREEIYLTQLINCMTDKISYRGPDARGSWVDLESGLVLGHRRLSVVDLSSEGAQPMVSSCGRYVVVFNGEIYNFPELYERLKNIGYFFRGRSDTEVLLNAISEWGLEHALALCNGMFAIAVWDKQEKNLCLARDRLGEKPLYYGNIGGQFVFGSELKVFRCLDSWNKKISATAANGYFRFGFVVGHESIYEGINRLTPGHILKISDFNSGLFDSHPFWSFEGVVREAHHNPYDGSLKAAEEELEYLISDSVSIRCRADVPLGAFLSGGVDSSLIVGNMPYSQKEPITTFCVGFENSAYDESFFAKRVAEKLGCNHRSVHLTESDVIDAVKLIPKAYDEPLADVAQIPTMMLSKYAREHVTVCLTGDGGDELFGGYYRHTFSQKYWGYISLLPVSVRRVLANIVRSGFSNHLSTFVSRRYGDTEAGILRFVKAFQASGVEELYEALLSKGYSPSSLFTDKPGLRSADLRTLSMSPGRELLIWDTLNYLPNDVLVKSDRASMYSSLELRSPFLDHRLVELAWRLPHKWLLDGHTGKRIIRNLLSKKIPQKLVDRPKKGFSVPIDEWLRTSLKSWASEVLMSGKSDLEPLNLNVERMWDEHQSRVANNGQILWRIIVWRTWFETWVHH